MYTQGSNPDARLNWDCRCADFEFFKTQGWIEGLVEINLTVNTSFAGAALKESGPHVRK
jgi:hypothetical protein